MDKKMGNLRVTALIDTYNYGHFIEEAIESVLGQDFPSSEMEILVVDDGSTDNTPERVKKFGDRIRYFYKENGGQASALNLGFEQARGEIIALLDADDLWLPNKIRKVVEAFEAHPDSGMVYHPFLFMTGEDCLKPVQDFLAISGFVPDSARDLLAYRGQATSGVSFRKSIVGSLLPIPAGLRIMADGFLVYLIVFLSPVLALPEPLTEYRIHRQNLFNFSKSEPPKLHQKLACQNILIQEIKAWIQSRGYVIENTVLSAYVKRLELDAMLLRFGLEGATRWQLFRHLREELHIYLPLWTRKYRFFKSVVAAGALLLGYNHFSSLRKLYGQSNFAIPLRRYICGF
jgi:glycosyltransferase involved in cell wall biosynthesis